MYLINGKYLENAVTGVERFAGELVIRLDRIIGKGRALLAVSAGAASIPELENIGVVKVGKHKRGVWEELDLPLYAVKHGYTLINLCSGAPLLKPDITCIHDMQIRVNPQFFTKKFVIWVGMNQINALWRAKALITVSEFSKSEIIKYFHPKKNIDVIYNSWEHEECIKTDERILERLPFLRDKDYYFAMSGIAPNKNMKWLVETARLNPDKYFVTSGNMNRKMFGNPEDMEEVDNFIFAGYLSDGEVKALMSHCKAFLFPTFYEGFGIPPMEALSCGADVAVSDRSCMSEIYGDAVAYINPDIPCKDIDSIVFPEKEKGKKLLERYSWDKSAQKLLELLDRYEKKKLKEG